MRGRSSESVSGVSNYLYFTSLSCIRFESVAISQRARWRFPQGFRIHRGGYSDGFNAGSTKMVDRLNIKLALTQRLDRRLVRPLQFQ
jgi:hypothetical protein